MRITSNMVRRNYQNNLSSTLNGLEQSRKQVETGRRFSKSYEDPIAAAKGSVLETRFARNGDYLNAVNDTQKWQDTQEDVLTQINKIAVNIDENYSVSAITGTAGDAGRKAYASTLRELQKSMVYTLNTKYGDAFAMAGSDGMNAPFELSEDGKTLMYRGLDVNDPANAEALDKLSKETAYVDLGFGLTFENGQVVSSSAFNAAYPGIKAVGFGQTADGTSQNLIVLAGQMADELDKETFDKESYEKLWTQFHQGTTGIKDQLSTLGTKTQLLEATKERLTTEKLNMTEQFDNTLNIDPAEAIMNHSWSQYVYNVALKIGTNIIGPSLLDFMK